MSRILVLALVLVFCGALVGSIYAQADRTQELVAALDKTKYKKKEKRDIKIEIYVNVKNEAVVKKNAAEYSGIYGDQNAGSRLTLKVASDGSAEGSGYDGDKGKLNYTLKNARVNGAMLTATKVFDNGETKKLEAVFVNRTVSSGTNADTITSHETAYGLGYIETYGPDSTSRGFLELIK